jgi:hypothetical protein
MLTLVKTDDAVKIVGIYSGKKSKRKADDFVYFTHETEKDNQNVAKAEGVLHLHRSDLKKEFRINDSDFKEVCRMIDNEEEPDQGDPLRHEFWQILERYENFLQREMWIGDDKDSFFEMNFPVKREDWPGTMTCIGSSGSGKTWHVVEMIRRYFRASGSHNRRQVVWLSPELKIDKTLKKLRDNERYTMWFHGIDISEKNLKEKGMDAASFFKTEISDKIDGMGEDLILVLDDFPDAARALYPFLERFYNSMLRVARHRNYGVISLIHTYAHGKASSQALQSNKSVVFYPRSQQSRCIQFLRDYLQLSTTYSKDLVRKFASLGRWMCIQMHSPVCIYNESYLVLL